MKEINLVTIGKLKDCNLQEIENNYLKRICSHKLNIHEIKSKSEHKDIETETALKKIKELSNDKKPYIILLGEKGELYDSQNFSKWFYKKIENINGPIFFVIAGAEGPSNKMMEKANCHISLSKLTFPHRIARIILIEQIYRAETIHLNHPYHN